MPGNGPELPAAEPVDPAVPAGDPALPSDGPKLPTAEQETLVSEAGVTSPPDTAAARSEHLTTLHEHEFPAR